MSEATITDDARLESERPQLLGLAYRMLGTVADAEDAVQEAYARWYRMPPADRAGIVKPGAWLMRVTSRICLDELGSARVRRESYVGEWLPEPLPDASLFAPPSGAGSPGADPLDRVVREDELSTAVLVVLESLSPAERVAFVLHDVFAVPFGEIAEVVGRSPEACRQLASQARRHVAERRGGTASRQQHDAVLRAFVAAASTGELGGLVALLDPSVRLVSDGGGLVSAARRPVHGSDDVARFVLGLMAKFAAITTLSTHETADGLVLAFAEGDVVGTVVTAEVRADRISELRIMRNPEKLRLWQRRPRPPGG
ncbi:RNA polymerase sigma factor SigJ [Agromyces soli]